MFSKTVFNSEKPGNNLKLTSGEMGMTHLYHGYHTAIKRNKTELHEFTQISIHGHTYYNMKGAAEVYFVKCIENATHQTDTRDYFQEGKETRLEDFTLPE